MPLQSAGEQLYGAGGVSTGLDVPTGKALFLEQGKADEIHKIPEKTTTTDNDVILIEDSEDGYKKKRVLAKNLKGKTGVDNAELWEKNTDYKADDVFHFSTSNITAKWADGSPITANSVYFAKYLVDTTSSNDLTNAEMAKFEVVSDGEKIDSSNFKAVGDENSIGINKNDNTLQKVINKVEDFKVTVPKAFEKVTLATDANLTALQALEPTTTENDLLFEFKASDGTKSYIVTPLDSFIDLKAIKKIEYKTLDANETILKITTIEGVESDLDLKRFVTKVLLLADVEDKTSKKEGSITGELLFKALEKHIKKAQLGEIFVGTDETPKLHSPKNLKEEIRLSENSNCLTKWNDEASWYGNDTAMDRVKFVLGNDGIVYEALKSLIPANTPITNTEHWKVVSKVYKETRFFDDINNAELETIEKNQLFVIGAETRNFYVGTYMNMGEPKKFSIIHPSKEIVQVVKGQSTLGKEFIIVDKIIAKPYPTEPNHTNGLDITENKILDSDGANFSERTHNYRDGMIVSVKEGNLKYRYVKATNSFVKLTKSVDSEPLVASLPTADTTIVHDDWSLNDVGFDLTKAKGYLMVGAGTAGATFIQPLRIELPMVAGEEYKGGNNAGNGVSSWQIRAVTRTATPTVLEVAGSFNPNSSHTSTLAYIKHYKEQSEVIDTNLVKVEDITADEIHTINEVADGTATTVTFVKEPYDLLIYGHSQGVQSTGITVSFKDLKTSGTLKKTITQHASRLTGAGDASEIAHIDFDVKYVNDTTIEINVIRSGYTEKANDYSQRSGYPIDKVIARFRGKDNISVIKPTDAKVPLGLEILLLEGTTDNNDSEVFEFAEKIPEGKRVIGIQSVLVAWNAGWLTADLVASLDIMVDMPTKTSMRLQSKSEHYKNKAYIFTLMLANIAGGYTAGGDGTTADMSAYMLKSDYDKNNNKVVDQVDNIDGGNF